MKVKWLKHHSLRRPFTVFKIARPGETLLGEGKNIPKNDWAGNELADQRNRVLYDWLVVKKLEINVRQGDFAEDKNRFRDGYYHWKILFQNIQFGHKRKENILG